LSDFEHPHAKITTLHTAIINLFCVSFSELIVFAPNDPALSRSHWWLAHVGNLDVEISRFN
jgi:hypothetical protein